MDNPPHARIFDLPGWPCPPTVAEIATHTGSYGWVGSEAVAFDGQGYLYVNGAEVPRVARSRDEDRTVLVAWCPEGIAALVPKDTHRSLTNRSRYLGPRQWIPINILLDELPEFVKTPE